MHQIRREKRPTISELIVRGKRIKHNGNRFYFNFFVESLSFKLNNSVKWKNLRSPLKVETNQFVFCLVLPECLSVKICCISPSDSEANRDGSNAESPFPLFFSLLRTLAREKRSESCLRFGTGGPSLCLYLLLSRNIIFCPALTMAARAKRKFLAKRFADAISARVQYRDLEHASQY